MEETCCVPLCCNHALLFKNSLWAKQRVTQFSAYIGQIKTLNHKLRTSKLEQSARTKEDLEQKRPSFWNMKWLTSEHISISLGLFFHLWYSLWMFTMRDTKSSILHTPPSARWKPITTTQRAGVIMPPFNSRGNRSMSLQSLHQLAEPGQSTSHLEPDLAARLEDSWVP